MTAWTSADPLDAALLIYAGVAGLLLVIRWAIATVRSWY